MMLDHPAWLTSEDGTAHRVVRSSDSVWSLAAVRGARDTVRVQARRAAGNGPAPTMDVFDPATLVGDDPVARALRQTRAVGRLRNPDLWDALATGIVRQVIRAEQARKLYRALCRRHGEPVATPTGTICLFPAPQVVLGLADADFAALGLAFKRPALQAAAQAYLRHGDSWAQLPLIDLVTAVQTVPRIGPWTAGAAIADAHNAYHLYPFADLAVRTWAARMVPDQPWPDTEPGFADVWQTTAGAQLSERTLLTLAFGVRHATHAGNVAM
jgi:DNA-3-methyladenine glycosylase II